MYKFTELPDTVFGKPIQHKVIDYKKISQYINLLVIRDYDIKRLYISDLFKSDNFTKEQKNESKKVIMQMSLVDIICGDVYGVLDEYIRMFNLFFDNFNLNELAKLKDNELDELLSLVVCVNSLPYDRKNPNDEIAKFDSMRSIINKFRVTMESMYYSVWALIGNSPDDLLLYDFYNLFNRLQLIKSYETSVLFKTVDTSGKVDIFPWFAEEDRDVKLISKEELKNRSI